MSATELAPAERLNEILMADDVSASLWAAIDSGRIDTLVPELPALRMEQDPIHRHKDVLSHTVAVVAKTPPDLVVRLAALFHDIAKPKTRSFEHGGVTFRHHEVVGGRMTSKRMAALGYIDGDCNEIAGGPVSTGAVSPESVSTGPVSMGSVLSSDGSVGRSPAQPTKARHPIMVSRMKPGMVQTPYGFSEKSSAE